MLGPAVAECPTATRAEERMLNATRRSITVNTEHRDGFAFRLVTLANPGTAAELAGWHRLLGGIIIRPMKRAKNRFGDYLQELRSAANWSLRDLSATAKISVTRR